MPDVQLRKKVQLKQKQEAPAVTLKRKGEAAHMVTLKTKKPEDAAIVGTAATAAAATAAAVAAKAASNAAAAGMASVPTTILPGVVAKPAVDSAKAATGATGAGTPGKIGDSKNAGTTIPSSAGNGGKKGGMAWAWILGAAVVAGLAFGGYKLATNNSSNDKTSLSAGNKTAVVEGQGNTTNGESNVANPSMGSASGTNSESPTDANGSERLSGTNGAASNNASAGAAGSNSGDSTGATGSGTSSDNSAAANTGIANGAQNSSTASAASPSNATKPAVISSVSDNQAVCLFAFDSCVVGESDVLDKLAASAKSSGRKVVINAYADEVGPDEYNQDLSQRRANAVKSYFIKKGVDAVVITASGKGETTQFAARAENRRADITIE